MIKPELSIWISWESFKNRFHEYVENIERTHKNLCGMIAQTQPIKKVQISESGAICINSFRGAMFVGRMPGMTAEKLIEIYKEEMENIKC